MTTVGFQKGAIGLAASSGIALFKVSGEDNFHLHAFQHALGPTNDILAYLTEQTAPYTGGSFREATGITVAVNNIYNFIAQIYGKDLSELLRREPEPNKGILTDVTDEELVVLARRLDSMPDNWMSDYLELESCCLPISVEPAVDFRLLNLHFMSVRQMLKFIDREPAPNSAAQADT